MSKIYELIRPKSLNDPAYEDYEYLLRWIGRDGSDYNYMFYDVEVNTRIRNDVVNSEDSDNIKAIIDKVQNSVTLTANDLTLNGLQLISQILEQTQIQRIKKDGTVDYYAPDSNRFQYRLKNGRYNLEFTLTAVDTKAWK